MTLSTIIVGYDNSADSIAALRWAADIAKTTGARLRIVHAVGLLEHGGMTSEHLVAYRQAALATATEVGQVPDRIEWLVEYGDPCSVLLRMSRLPEGADLLVMGSRGSHAHGGSLLGSTSLEVAEHATLPVAIVPLASGAENSPPV